MGLTAMIAVMLSAFFAVLTPLTANALYNNGQFAKVNPYKPPPPHPGNFPAALSAGKFLIASRTLKDPRFAQTVILILDYGQGGATGVIINRPTNIKLSDALPHAAEFHGLSYTVYIGGPVMPNGMTALIRSSEQIHGAARVFGDVHVSPSLDAIKGIIGKNTRTLRFFAGYAGWGPRQLDGEVARGGWHVLPADAETVFTMSPAEVWSRLMLILNATN
ncbi:MAG: YqgE/AlgH family protein [Deltaproteobacteria bacterium]|nr:YqgE/AlgH family protein [Deltaproteobacteria bacterium]